MSDIITTLHPENDEEINLYPNVKKENIPSGSVDESKLSESINNKLNGIATTLTNAIASISQPKYYSALPTSDVGLIVYSDGYIYSWNGTQYITTGILYQAIQLNDSEITSISKVKNLIDSLNYYSNDILHGKFYNNSGVLEDNDNSLYLDTIDVTNYRGGYIKIISKNAFSTSSNRLLSFSNYLGNIITAFEKSYTPTLNDDGNYEIDIYIRSDYSLFYFSVSSGVNVISVSINKNDINEETILDIVDSKKVLIQTPLITASTNRARFTSLPVNNIKILNVINPIANVGVVLYYRTSNSGPFYNLDWDYNEVVNYDLSNYYDFYLTFRKLDNSNFTSEDLNNLNNNIKLYNSLATENVINEVYVDGVNGSDSNSGSLTSPFKTINMAISSGVKNIRIKYGEYAETINLSNVTDYTFTSYGLPSYSSATPDTPLVHLNGGSEKTITSGIILNNCSNITFENIWCDNTSAYGANIVNCNNIIMTNCKFSNTFNDGLRLVNTNGTFNNCVAYNIGDSSLEHADGYNIHGYGSTTFNNCIAYDCLDDGISHHDGCAGYINGGEFYRCGKGGVASPTHGAVIQITGVYSHNNTKYGLLADSGTTGRTNSILVTNCVFKNNNLYDINCVGYTLNLVNCIYTTTTGTGTINNLNN